MNEYFKRTPDSINYDGAQPGAGDLYDLRVATRNEIERLEKLIIENKDWIIDIFEGDVEDNRGGVADMRERIDELERITKVQADDIDYNDDRIRDLMAAGTVDHGKYAHLTEAQIERIVNVLRAYANPDNWWTDRNGKEWFCNNHLERWGMATEALREAGLK